MKIRWGPPTSLDRRQWLPEQDQAGHGLVPGKVKHTRQIDYPFLLIRGKKTGLK